MSNKPNNAAAGARQVRGSVDNTAADPDEIEFAVADNNAGQAEVHDGESYDGESYYEDGAEGEESENEGEFEDASDQEP